jgi:glycosyltransferase involved in cell wall biosynthesis
MLAFPNLLDTTSARSRTCSRPGTLRRPLRVLELRCAEGEGGGPEKTILNGAAWSDPEQFAVTVCYLRDSSDVSTGIPERAAALGLDYGELRPRGPFDAAVFPALRRLVRERSIDLVHAHDYKSDLFALLLGRLEGVIPLATAHGWTGSSRRERLFYYPLDRRLLAWFPRVLAVSEEIREELIRRGADPCRVQTLLNGIDHQAYRRDPKLRAAARARFGLSTEEFALGSAGRLSLQKRIDLLLVAFARFRQHVPATKLFVAGDGELRAALEAEASRLGIADSCRFLGHVEDIVGFHHALDLFIQSSDYEGTPNVVLEAMALETPVVATAVGGTTELIQHETHGLLVPPREPEALAEAMTLALTRPDRTARRVQAARQRVVSDLSFEARMRKLESVYDELTAHRPGESRDREAPR